jgi:hypothetical protein
MRPFHDARPLRALSWEAGFAEEILDTARKAPTLGQTKTLGCLILQSAFPAVPAENGWHQRQRMKQAHQVRRFRP